MRIIIVIALLLILPAISLAQPATPMDKVKGRPNTPLAVVQYMTELYSPWPQNRADAVAHLGEMGEAAAAAVPLLIEMLADGAEVKRDPNIGIVYVGTLAEDALVKIGEPAFQPLLAALNNDNWHIRAGAALALGKTHDARAIEPLIAAVRNKELKIQGWAAKGLSLMGGQAIEPLIRLLNDGGYEAQFAAQNLGEIGDPRAIEPLVALLSRDANYTTDVNMALAKIGKPAVEALIGLLSRDNPDIRADAAAALGSIRDKKATQPLFAALSKESDDMVKEAIFDAIGEIKDPEAVPQLSAIYYTALTEKDNPASRLHAVEALGNIGDPRAVETLLLAFTDKEKWVRAEAIIAMCKIKDKRLIEPLIAALGQEEEFPPGLFTIFSDIRDCLHNMTGQDFGEDPAKWRQWWEANKAVR